MKKLMKRKMFVCVIVAVFTLAILVAGCSNSGTTSVTDASDARDAVLDYLDDNYDDNIPGPNLLWQEEDKTPAGIVGSVVKAYTSEGWTMLISYPVVNPEATVFSVTLVSSGGWKWEGSVDADGSVTETRPLTQITEEESLQIAEDFVKNSATFAFDGIADTLEYADLVIIRTPSAWQFTFKFQSRHAGYGDRSGQIVAQVITTHTAVIDVIQGEVVTAVLDNKWDMLEQEMVTGSISEEQSRQIAEDFVRNCPTFKFDGIADTLMLLETLYPETENTWKFAYSFESANVGYGDRTGQALDELITLHQAVITVQDGMVDRAVMDGSWDMIDQQLITNTEISLAKIHEVEVYFMESFPVQVGVLIKGGLPNGCTVFNDAVVTRDGDTVNVEVTVQTLLNVPCTEVYTIFEENINLGSDFVVGDIYTLNVNDYTTTFTYQ